MKYEIPEIQDKLVIMLREIYINHQTGSISELLKQKHRGIISSAGNNLSK